MAREKDDSMSTAEAGRKGGEEVVAKYGPEHMAEIGREGGKAQGKENNPENFANKRKKAQDAGKKGGSR